MELLLSGMPVRGPEIELVMSPVFVILRSAMPVPECKALLERRNFRESVGELVKRGGLRRKVARLWVLAAYVGTRGVREGRDPATDAFADEMFQAVAVLQLSKRSDKLDMRMLNNAVAWGDKVRDAQGDTDAFIESIRQFGREHIAIFNECREAYAPDVEREPEREPDRPPPPPVDPPGPPGPPVRVVKIGVDKNGFILLNEKDTRDFIKRRRKGLSATSAEGRVLLALLDERSFAALDIGNSSWANIRAELQRRFVIRLFTTEDGRRCWSQYPDKPIRFIRDPNHPPPD